jgi:hypothetical protein
MSKGKRFFEKEIALSGSGTGWDSEAIDEFERVGGRVVEILARQDAGGGATAASFYLVQTDSAVSATPDDLDLFYKNTGVAMSASATAASLIDTVTVGGSFRKDVGKRVAVNVTAGSGAWTINVVVKVEADV